jgi:CelD/BcsL family acetyltransferase involved in cellulose biosynthesis
MVATRLPDGYKLEILDRPHALRALRGDWDDLYARAARPSVTQSFAWAWCAWQHLVEPKGGRLFCVVLRQGGRADLIWPMAVLRHRGLWSRATALGPVEFTEPLAHPGDAAAALATAAWGALCSRSGADLIHLDSVRAESSLYATLRCGQVYGYEAGRNYRLLLGQYGDWSSYHASLGKKQRTNLARAQKKLDGLGPHACALVEDAQARRRVLKWTIARKTRWLAERGLDTALIGSPLYAKFWESLLSEGMSPGSVEVYTLQLNGRIIAADACYRNRHRIEGVIGAFDPEYEKVSPGLLLRMWVAERAQRESVPEFSLGPGGSSFKAALTGDSVDTAHFRIQNSLWGTVFARLQSATGYLSRRRGLPGTGAAPNPEAQAAVPRDDAVHAG